MEVTQELQLRTRADGKPISSSLTNEAPPPPPPRPPPPPPRPQRFKHYSWWLRVSFYTLFVLAGQSAATLLGELYYDKGGSSKWMATLVQSCGFPILMPLLFFSPPKTTTTTTVALLYVAFGALLMGDNMLYSIGLRYLPVSTYSLLCASQLAFNALFSFLLNSQKFTPYILNSLTLLTISASLLALHSDSDTNTSIPKGKYAIGFISTVAASALYSLYLSLVQLSFQKIIKTETFSSVLEMQIYPSFIASCFCLMGFFVGGDWKKVPKEMKEYQESKVSYVMTLLWTAISWQVCSIGLLGLIFEVSSLFSNVISTLGLPVVPILAVIFFRDTMDGIKAIAMILAIWGFVSYIYQHYLDDRKLKANTTSADVSRALVEVY